MLVTDNRLPFKSQRRISIALAHPRGVRSHPKDNEFITSPYMKCRSTLMILYFNICVDNLIEKGWRVLRSGEILLGDLNIIFYVVVHLGHLDFVVDNVGSEVPE